MVILAQEVTLPLLEEHLQQAMLLVEPFPSPQVQEPQEPLARVASYQLLEDQATEELVERYH